MFFQNNSIKLNHQKSEEFGICVEANNLKKETKNTKYVVILGFPIGLQKVKKYINNII